MERDQIMLTDMEDAVKLVQEELFARQDLHYKDFHCKLIPTVNPEEVIGVRTPVLRKFARSFVKAPQSRVFLKALPHRYYDENNLHGFLIETIPNYDEALTSVEAFLPYVNNWATCDLLSPKVFKRHLSELYDHIPAWLHSQHPYTVRFGIGTLMRFYLEDTFVPEMPEMVAAIHSEEYYVKMMIAWYFATALAKQYEATIPYLQERRLEKWIHNKTIQKAIESYRIPEETKERLRTLRIK